MNFVNPPERTPGRVSHHTFYSQGIGGDVGYNIYLPPGYEDGVERYPVNYHLHGYRGDESSEIWAMEKVYQGKGTILVFANATSGDKGYGDGELLIETTIIRELLPHIDATYRTDRTREGRSVSGFSMGGAGAFYLSVKYLELFHAVTAYAGTYHHFFSTEYQGVGEPMEKARVLYEEMKGDDRCFDRNQVLRLPENAAKLRERLRIALVVGTVDPLICDNEIMHLYLESLNVPHTYKKIRGAEHDLSGIV